MSGVFPDIPRASIPACRNSFIKLLTWSIVTAKTTVCFLLYSAKFLSYHLEIRNYQLILYNWQQ